MLKLNLMKKNLSNFAASFVAGYFMLGSMPAVHAQSGVCFNPHVDYVAGSGPYSVCSADYNGDGSIDMSMTNFTANTVMVFMNTGTGTFGAPATYTAGTNPISIATADFNLDGWPDLAVANNGSNNVSILLNTGTGTFTSTINYTAGTSPFSINAIDYNADGNIDLAVANNGGNNVSILFGTATGIFGVAANYGTDLGPYSIISADYNGDGAIDLASANYTSNDVSVLLNTGSGAFNVAVNFTVGTTPTSISSADYNGDGSADLSVACINGPFVSVFLNTNTGTGTFATAVNYTAGTQPLALNSSDFNGDGISDLAVTVMGSNNVAVLLNAGNGSGMFGTAANFAAGTLPNAICSSDYNGDGKIDLAVANYSSNNVSILLQCSLRGTALNSSFTTNQANLGTSMDAVLGTLNQITVEAWVNPADTAAANGEIIGNYSSPLNQLQFLLRRDNGGYNFFVDAGSGFQNVYSGRGVATIGTWQHLAGVWDGSKIMIYVNGALKATTTGITGPHLNSTVTNSVVMCYEPAGAGEPFNGGLDEVRIWKRALCQSEIQNGMNGELKLPQTGLLAYYPLNEGMSEANNFTVTAVADSSGNNYNGTLLNFSLSGSLSNWIAPSPVATGSYAPAFVSPTVTVSGNSTICAGSSTTLTAIGNVSTYVWTSGPSTATYVVSPTTTVSYSVAGTNSVGCVSNTAITTVTVNPHPTITATNGTVCVGTSFTLSPNGALTYTFMPTGPVVTPTANATYTVSGTDVNGCMGKDSTIMVTVNALPSVMATANSATVCSGIADTLHASGASTYTWSSNASSAMTASVIVTQTMTTTYTVMGTNSNGCMNSNMVTITVSTCSNGITQYNTSSLQVYPNPSTGVFTLHSETELGEVYIYNYLNQMVYHDVIHSNGANIDLSFLQSGMYQMRIQNSFLKIMKAN